MARIRRHGDWRGPRATGDSGRVDAVVRDDGGSGYLAGGDQPFVRRGRDSQVADVEPEDDSADGWLRRGISDRDGHHGDGHGRSPGARLATKDDAAPTWPVADTPNSTVIVVVTHSPKAGVRGSNSVLTSKTGSTAASSAKIRIRLAHARVSQTSHQRTFVNSHVD